MFIYHIVLPIDWEASDPTADYTAASLSSEGFIHCSFAEQLDQVLGRYYSGVKEVIILTIDTEKLSARLVEEPSTNNEIYPHIYGSIDRAAIVGTETRRS